jgi:hypothetical protein
MGLEIEFNTLLVLRNMSEFHEGTRKKEECIPSDLEKEVSYSFLKSGQRIYPLMKEMALLETRNGNLSDPVAKIILTEINHMVYEEKLYTRGTYQVVNIIDDLSRRSWWNCFK